MRYITSRKIKIKPPYFKRTNKVVSTNTTNVTTTFICDTKHAIY